MKIGLKLKQARLKKELTQENVANILNVSRSTISSWEVGRSYPDLESIVSLSDLYNISLDKLLREDSDMIKKLSLDSKIINKIGKLLNYLPIIIFIIFLCSILYINIAENTYNKLSEQMNNEIKALSLKYDMTEVNRYKKELDSILNKNEFKTIKSIEIYVADMEKGNKNLETDKYNFRLLYETVDPKSAKGRNLLKNSIGILSKDILDKDGNIVHHQSYMRNYHIFEMEFVALVFGILGFISLLVSIIIKFKNTKR
ncbi:helix-turn-helix transcriptional regulator [Clostridium sp. CCUG 7971]|uniref:helix-turn-helix domain-containing protein n=1 Tax=Clostridium sp. CCUG 7971 TaxID=2811414 RepID=UPI001ABAC5C0|nr:helix-turn-helix transcriptional regulator [Clostridium sp. CCUG 7971]MBO3443492.1 helix-turn-helix transcriptional regulator [Clostridium sp. CCUG 7971]